MKRFNPKLNFNKLENISLSRFNLVKQFFFFNLEESLNK